MNLSTLFFVFAFLPVSLILYLVCPRVCKNALLVLISFVFYAWGSPVYLLLLLLVTVFNYCVGLDIGNCAELGRRGTKFLLVIGVLFNLLLLGFYKYAAFAIETLNAILPFTLNAPSAALPLGISFFTFQNLSYLSDVYHRRAPAQKNPLDFCLYVSFFPKMISGPIVEYAQFEPQLKSHPVTLYKVSEAVPMLVLGLAKKVLLADNLGAAFQSISALSSGSLSGGSAWLGAICYSLQLYFDFSGYSDMAIGMAKLFGFDFDANFDHPYLSASLTEFWRRWHISLGRWFRDYVYIPLGGSRVSTPKCIRNLLIVWILTVIVGWVLFFSPDFSSAIFYLGRMFGAGSRAFWDSTAKYYFAANWKLLVLGILGCGPWIRTLYRHLVFSRRSPGLVLSALLLIGIFLLCVPYMTNATYQSFLYAQF